MSSIVVNNGEFLQYIDKHGKTNGVLLTGHNGGGKSSFTVGAGLRGHGRWEFITESLTLLHLGEAKNGKYLLRGERFMEGDSLINSRVLGNMVIEFSKEDMFPVHYILHFDKGTNRTSHLP